MRIVLILEMKWKWLTLIITALLLVVLVAFVSRGDKKSSFDGAREMIIMRKIAHEVLLYTGDSISPVQSIEKISATEFKIPFATSFGFKPDSLVQIIGRVIKESHLPSNYIVNVWEPNLKKVIFGYAILGSRQNNIIPCQGRDQPARQYYIMIQFPEPEAETRNWYLAGIGMLCILLFALFIKLSRNKIAPSSPIDQQQAAPLKETPVTSIPIGPFQFNPAEQFLLRGEIKTELTAKESRLLEIFAASPNQVVERNRLQKEVWEDEGVIVGRSLDVFISKLRKKLEGDDLVRIINVHGKGYKLVISDISNL